MFNGIIFNQGIITRILKVNKGIYLFLKSNLKVNNKNIGISISCDGVCLTVISVKNKVLKFYLSNETIARSKFNKSKLGDKINLELPLKYGQKISGHICQGHIDSVAKIEKQVKTNTADIAQNVSNNIKVESASSDKKHKKDKADEEAASTDPQAGMAAGITTITPSAKASSGI